jgi:ATP-binding cassette subfamily B protein
MGFTTQLNMLILISYGGMLVIRGEIRLGEGLFVFANLLNQFANQVGQITNVANTIQSSLVGAQRVFEVLDAPIEIKDAEQVLPLARARGEVTFRNVSFTYQPATPATEQPALNKGSLMPMEQAEPPRQILSDISFTALPGECIALVGATGAGKSTLLSLIPRFYDPTAGQILLDGMDLRQLSVQDLRRQIGIVFQESFLFSNTVAANIAFGSPEATEEQIVQAARMAQAEEFILNLPEGYQTVIGEYGCDLSGGQRQRLALARALLLNPAILILDDATSAIDPETEREILAAMDRAIEGRTTFITAHRLSTLRRADRIIVLEQGRISQMGTHEELMAQPGHYQEAALRQMSLRQSLAAPERIHAQGVSS